MSKLGTGHKFTYADEAWNVLHGCQPVSSGCSGCWAAGMATRHRNASARGGRWTGEVVLFPERLEQPLRWRKPRVIAVQYMGDLFYERVPFEYIAAVFGVMAACPQHTFLVLTKRPERMRKWFEWVDSREKTGRALFPWDGPSWRIGQLLAVELGKHGVNGSRKDFDPRRNPWPLPNVWLGVSAEEQRTLEERWKHLRECPAVAWWISLVSVSRTCWPGWTSASGRRAGRDWWAANAASRAVWAACTSALMQQGPWDRDRSSSGSNRCTPLR